jgi:hypothetical protein
MILPAIIDHCICGTKLVQGWPNGSVPPFDQ